MVLTVGHIVLPVDMFAQVFELLDIRRSKELFNCIIYLHGYETGFSFSMRIVLNVFVRCRIDVHYHWRVQLILVHF